jgi:hypothetical protein
MRLMQRTERALLRVFMAIRQAKIAGLAAYYAAWRAEGTGITEENEDQPDA